MSEPIMTPERERGALSWGRAAEVPGALGVDGGPAARDQELLY